MRKWLAFLAVYFCLCLIAGGASLGGSGTGSDSSESGTIYEQDAAQTGPVARQIPEMLETGTDR
jgi:hypothetical protein